MGLNKEKSILNLFLAFFIAYSIIAIFLGVITGNITTIHGSILISINLLQIVSLILILFSYKDNIGAYIFFIIRFLNIVLVYNTSIRNIIIVMFNNILIATAFYMLYYGKYWYTITSMIIIYIFQNIDRFGI